jgi:regulator of replication initiation timing
MFCREGTLKQATSFLLHVGRLSSSILIGGLLCGSVCAQQPGPSPDKKNLAEAVQELRAQVQQLQAAVAEIKSEASQYRAESQELRHQLESMRAGNVPAQTNAESATGAASVEQRISSLEETAQVLQSESKTQYQSKVESASRYRARISGLVLLNVFSNRSRVDNQDVPTYAAPRDSYDAKSSFGATLRQSEVGLEVFGPQVGGAKTSGSVQFDFGGGFPTGAIDGINTGVVRMRRAAVRLDWEHTSLIAGQDDLFISPLAPTSFASLITPSFGYSGNLWAWTPQVRIEHRFDLGNSRNIVLQAGFLDNVTGEPSYGTHRQPQAGESSGQPAYAVRAGWASTDADRTLSFGASGYYSRQDWGFDWNVDGWAAAADWRIPLPSGFELSGEFYRGRGVGGLGGGIGQSILFSGSPSNPFTDFRALDSAGGWSQLKFAATPRLEFNGVFGMDNPFASDIHAFPAPVDYYPWVLTANRSEMANFIYRPRSDLLFSGEYRHLRTTQVGAVNSADQVNMMVGVLF